MKKIKKFIETYHISISIIIGALIIGHHILRAASNLGSVWFMTK